MKLPGQPGYGLPPNRDQLVDLARRVSDLEARDTEDRSALSNSLSYQSFSADAGSLSFPSGAGYSAYAITSAITVPPGMTACLIFAVAYAGCTFSGAGSISVGIGDSTTSSSGPWSPINPIANGVSGAAPCSANSTLSYFNTNLTPGQNNWLSAMVAVNGTSGATGNAHINGIVIWMRS